MTISHFYRRMVVCLFIVLPNAGCLGYLDYSKWKGSIDFDASRISEIVVGKTTRGQIEAMFGKPRSTFGRSIYMYFLTRFHAKRDIIIMSGSRSTVESKRLLYVMFLDGDIVRAVSSPEPGAIEILEQLQKERRTSK